MHKIKVLKVNDLVVFVITVGNDGPLFHDVSVKEVLINGLNLISAKASKGTFNSKKLFGILAI